MIDDEIAQLLLEWTTAKGGFFTDEELDSLTSELYAQLSPVIVFERGFFMESQTYRALLANGSQAHWVGERNEPIWTGC